MLSTKIAYAQHQTHAIDPENLATTDHRHPLILIASRTFAATCRILPSYHKIICTATLTCQLNADCYSSTILDYHLIRPRVSPNTPPIRRADLDTHIAIRQDQVVLVRKSQRRAVLIRRTRRASDKGGGPVQKDIEEAARCCRLARDDERVDWTRRDVDGGFRAGGGARGCSEGGEGAESGEDCHDGEDEYG